MLPTGDINIQPFTLSPVQYNQDGNRNSFDLSSSIHVSIKIIEKIIDLMTTLPAKCIVFKKFFMQSNVRNMCKAPNYLNKYIIRNMRNYTLRNDDTLAIGGFLRHNTQNSLTFNGFSQLNSIPFEIKIENSTHLFLNIYLAFEKCIRNNIEI